LTAARGKSGKNAKLLPPHDESGGSSWEDERNFEQRREAETLVEKKNLQTSIEEGRSKTKKRGREGCRRYHKTYA